MAAPSTPRRIAYDLAQAIAQLVLFRADFVSIARDAVLDHVSSGLLIIILLYVVAGTVARIRRQ